MSNREIGPVAKELIAAKKRIEDPENWCPEGEGLYGADGHRVCAVLALGCDCTLANNEAYGLLQQSGRELFGESQLVYINRRGHSAVMQVYDHAIQHALSEGK